MSPNFGPRDPREAIRLTLSAGIDDPYDALSVVSATLQSIYLSLPLAFASILPQVPSRLSFWMGFGISDIHAKMCRKKITVGFAHSTLRSEGAVP